MNYIKINIDNKQSNIDIYIDVLKQKININNQEKIIAEEKIDDLIRIIRTWKNEYNNNKFIDSEKIIIKISTNEENEIIKCSGEYPENYLSLKEWISDIIEYSNI